MHSKAPLALMEQIVMLLVFALSAALCLQDFALSGKGKTHFRFLLRIEFFNGYSGIGDVCRKGDIMFLRHWVSKPDEDIALGALDFE